MAAAAARGRLQLPARLARLLLLVAPLEALLEVLAVLRSLR